MQPGLRGPMDKALVYGTRDSGFDPQRSRLFFFALLKFNRDKECAHAELTFAPERKQGTQLINLLVP